MDLSLVYSHKKTRRLLWIKLRHHQTLLWSILTVALIVWSEQKRNPLRFPLNHAQNFMQDITHAVFWDANCFHFLVHLQSAVCHHEVLGFSHIMLRSSRFSGTWAGLIKNRRVTTVKLIKPSLTVTIEEEKSPDTASKRSLILLHYFSSKIENQMTNWYCSFPFF